MKKGYAFIISLAVIAAFFSFSSLNINSVSRLMIGQQIPVTDFFNDFPDETGKGLVWINFWASYDAASRDENVRFSAVVKRVGESYSTKNQSFKSISISMDKFEGIFEEVVRQDNLNFSQIHREPEGFQSEFAKKLN
jgi:thiol-disulfide isomerase/thioredoxin